MMYYNVFINKLFVFKSLQNNEGESNIEISNARMNIMDSTSNNGNGVTNKKRFREKEDVSTDERMDDHDAHQKKKSITKDC